MSADVTDEELSALMDEPVATEAEYVRVVEHPAITHERDKARGAPYVSATREEDAESFG